MKRAFYRTVTLIILAVFLTACASETFDPADAYKDKSESQIFNLGLKNQKKGYYRDAIQYFETLDARYPFGTETKNSQLDIIYCYYMNGDMPSTIAASERYIHLYPTGKNVDYAYYMRGLSNYTANFGFVERHFKVEETNRDLASMQKAFLNFAQVINQFPNSKYVEDSRLHMIFIKNMMAQKIYNIGEYYYGRKAYIAAANRANDVVRHYQGAPVVPDAMVLMIKSYQKANAPQLGDDAMTVFKYNFPNAKAFKDV